MLVSSTPLFSFSSHEEEKRKLGGLCFEFRRAETETERREKFYKKEKKENKESPPLFLHRRQSLRRRGGGQREERGQEKVMKSGRGKEEVSR